MMEPGWSSVATLHQTQTIQRLRGTSKFTQHQNPVELLLARDIFIRYQIHAIARGRNNANVGDAVERRQLFKIHRLIHKMNRHEVNCSCVALIFRFLIKTHQIFRLYVRQVHSQRIEGFGIPPRLFEKARPLARVQRAVKHRQTPTELMIKLFPEIVGDA